MIKTLLKTFQTKKVDTAHEYISGKKSKKGGSNPVIL